MPNESLIHYVVYKLESLQFETSSPFAMLNNLPKDLSLKPERLTIFKHTINHLLRRQGEGFYYDLLTPIIATLSLLELAEISRELYLHFPKDNFIFKIYDVAQTKFFRTKAC